MELSKKTKARLYQGLIYLGIFLLTWFIGHFFLDDNLNFRGGILGMISASLALLLTPKMKIIEFQSGQQIQVSSVFIKGAKFIK
jgi:hypothetical protein